MSNLAPAGQTRAELRERLRLLGVPDPPTSLYDDPGFDWADLYGSLEDTALERLADALAPCPMCKGSTKLEFRVIDIMSLASKDSSLLCPGCQGVGKLPTKRGLRMLQTDAGQARHRAKAKLAVTQRTMREINWLIEGKEPPHTFQLAIETNVGPDAGKRIDMLTATEEQRQYALQLLEEEQGLLRDEIKEHGDALAGLGALAAMVASTHTLAKWLATCSAATTRYLVAPPPDAEPLAVPEQPRCHCGKHGDAQQPDGSWLCKRHAYEAGLVEHTAAQLKAAEVAEQEVCDWCERRPAQRTYEGFRYCGPCAEDAQLPAEAAA